MPIVEGEIVLPNGEKERVLTDTVTGRMMEVVALTNPTTGVPIIPGSEATLQAILAAIQAGGGGALTTLELPILAPASAPVAKPDKYIEYVVDNGQASPNRNVVKWGLLPDGTTFLIQEWTI